MSNPDKPKVVTTRWWWVRHAPVRNDGGNIYGQKDLACDTSDREVFEAVAKILPRNAVWYASNLKRTHQTAEAIWAAGFPKPADDAAGSRLRRTASRPMAGHEPRRVPRQPAGRQQLVCRHQRARARRREFHGPLSTASAAAIERINAEQAGRDVIAVAHGGTIKAAVGLALGGQPEKGLAFDIDNCSVTRLDHFASAGHIELAAADGQPAALDRGRSARRDASAGGTGSRAAETKLA